MEGLAGSGQGADSAGGEEDGDGSSVGVDLLSDERADFGGFFDVGPHEGDLRVVFVEQTVFEFFGDGVFALEVDHIDASGGDDGGEFGASGCVESVGAC